MERGKKHLAGVFSSIIIFVTYETNYANIYRKHATELFIHLTGVHFYSRSTVFPQSTLSVSIENIFHFSTNDIKIHASLTSSFYIAREINKTFLNKA